MTEILFYHLQGQKLEGVLTPLLEKSLERGWKVVVQGASEERIEALDAHLWTYRDDGFLPHGTWREQDAAARKAVRRQELAESHRAHFAHRGRPVAPVCRRRRGLVQEATGPSRADFGDRYVELPDAGRADQPLRALGVVGGN